MLGAFGMVIALFHACAGAPDLHQNPSHRSQRPRHNPWMENVVGGTPAVPGEFPYLVSLRVPDKYKYLRNQSTNDICPPCWCSFAAH